MYWGVGIWLHRSSDRWALELLSSTAEVGLYEVLFQLGFQPLLFISTFIGFLVSPIIFDKAGDLSDEQRFSNINRLILKFTLLLLGVVMFLFFLANTFHLQLFQLFTSTDFYAISYMLPVMILSGGIFACGELIGLPLQAKLRTDVLLYPKLGSAVLGVFVNFFAAFRWGLEGVIYGGIFTAFIFLFSVLYVRQKYT